MSEKEQQTPANTQERAGPAREFAAFSKLEYERRRNSEQDFDAQLFEDAVALVLSKISGPGDSAEGDTGDDHQ